MEHKDLPKDELVKHANETLRLMKGAADVYFKFTCERCGARVALQEPNVLYEIGECCECGHKTEIKEGGYMLHVIMK